MQTVIDMMGRSVTLKKHPLRIVSLVPSQTELLYDLGLKEQVVGQTVFCIHPESEFKTAVKVGGTKKLKYEVIDTLQPDLIICNKEENTQEIVETLAAKYPVWVSDINTLDDNYTMIRLLGEVLNKTSEATLIINEIKAAFNTLQPTPLHTCLYLIWKNPYIGAGANTFINALLPYAGFTNVISHISRYPELSNDEIVKFKPQTILLSSEPYPFAEKHMAELQMLLPNTHIQLVDGEMFSWYGSRIRLAPAYFSKLS